MQIRPIKDSDRYFVTEDYFLIYFVLIKKTCTVEQILYLKRISEIKSWVNDWHLFIYFCFDLSFYNFLRSLINFSEKFHDNINSPYMKTTKDASTAFVIKHYAGDVSTASKIWFCRKSNVEEFIFDYTAGKFNKNLTPPELPFTVFFPFWRGILILHNDVLFLLLIILFSLIIF